MEPFLELYRLKDVSRTGWRLRGILEPESVADHSWGTALLVSRYCGEGGVECERALRMAVIHDLTEVRVGDIPRRVDPRVEGVSEEEKRRREERAARAISRELDWPEFERLWREYDEGESAEARFVRDMNLLDMVLQATLYAAEGRWDGESGAESFPTFYGLDEFFETSRPRIATELGRRLYGEVERFYRRFREG
ncbi:MAG: HD domain-containing protein [Spirochaetaceae bacterium]